MNCKNWIFFLFLLYKTKCTLHIIFSIICNIFPICHLDTSLIFLFQILFKYWYILTYLSIYLSIYLPIFITTSFGYFFNGNFLYLWSKNQVIQFLYLKKRTLHTFLDLLSICHPSTARLGSLTTWTINEVPWSSKILWFYFLENHLVESQCL